MAALKAHIAKAQPLALAYRLAESELAAVRALGFAARAIRPEQLGCRVGDLVAGEAPGAYEGEAPQEKLLVLDGFSRPDLDRLLAGLRAAGVFVPLKAVVTPSNRTWTVAALMGELARERASLEGGPQMNIDKLLEQIRAERCAAFVYEKAPAGASSFRDRVIFYRDGKARFERYCQARPPARCAS